MRLQDLSVKRKLTIGTMLVSGLSLLAACVAFVLMDQIQQHDDLVRRLRSISDIVSFNSAAALEFQDRAGAEIVLSALHLEKSIDAGRIFLEDGSPFASYVRSGMPEAQLPNSVPPEEVYSTDSHLILVRAIVLDGERIGTLYLRSDLSGLRSALARNLRVTGAVLAACLVIALLLGLGIQRMISGPIRSLADTAKRISEENDYSVRAAKHGQDELGALVDAFNQMLERIEQDADLKRQRARLEAEVERRKRLYEELKEEKERAEAAVVAKTNFLTNMSHEIRTPMTAIFGFADELLEAGDISQAPADRLEALYAIKRNGSHLIAILNDILDIAKVEAGRLSVEQDRFYLLQIIEDVVALMRIHATEKDLRLDLEYEPPVPETIEGDPTRLKQVLLNLVGNALKFTERGSVTLNIRMLGDASTRRIRFSVVDTGIGISEEHCRHLFQAFEQVDDSASREHGGSGLGLAISKRLVELMGGSIELESEPGRGSTFTVEVPTGSIEGVRMISDPDAERRLVPGEPSGSSPSLKGCRVLVAEDAPDNQRLIRSLLHRAGADVELAENGRVAVEKALAAWEAAHPFDLILMDMQMPEVDGYEATRTLRARDYQGPIIALTAHAMEADRERCLLAGCDGFQTKPLNKAALIETLYQHVQKARADETR